MLKYSSRFRKDPRPEAAPEILVTFAYIVEFILYLKTNVTDLKFINLRFCLHFMLSHEN